MDIVFFSGFVTKRFIAELGKMLSMVLADNLKMPEALGLIERTIPKLIEAWNEHYNVEWRFRPDPKKPGYITAHFESPTTLVEW